MFLTNPKPFINNYIETEIMPKKNPTAFFPTPKNLVDDMFRIANFDYFDDEFQKNLKILEPSAGVGGISDSIRKITPYSTLDIVEILDINQEVLKKKGYDPICMDFMEYNKDYIIKYDYIFMNPPYQGTTYIKHIKHAFKMLKDNGTLCAIIPSSFISNKDKLSNWMYEKATQLGNIYHNQEGSFKEQGTNVETCIVHLDKSTIKWKLNEYQECKNFFTWQVWISLYTNSNFYSYLEKLKYSDDIKEHIKTKILKELDNYKKEYSYFSYEFIDDYVEKMFEYWCYINDREELLKDNTEVVKDISVISELDRNKQMFKQMAKCIYEAIEDNTFNGKKITYKTSSKKYNTSTSYFGSQSCFEADEAYNNNEYNGYMISAKRKNNMSDFVGIEITQRMYTQNAPFELVKNSEVLITKETLDEILFSANNDVIKLANLLKDYYDNNNKLNKYLKINENNNALDIKSIYNIEQLNTFASGLLF